MLASSTVTSRKRFVFSFPLSSPVFVTRDEEEDASRGDLVVIGLVVGLLSFMFATFTVTAFYLRGDDWLNLVAPAARLTHSASFALAAFCGIDAWRRGRTGWWLYILAGGVPLVQWAVVIFWLRSGRGREHRLLRWTI